MAKKEEKPKAKIPAITVEKREIEIDTNRYRTYADKLKHPFWQRKRLEVYQRDNWTCRLCDSDQITLNVHHLVYNPGCNPWEYENESLITLCEDCHAQETFDLPKAVEELGNAFKKHGSMAADMMAIAQTIVDRPFDKDFKYLVLLAFYDEKTFAMLKERLREYREENKSKKENDGKATD